MTDVILPIPEEPQALRAVVRTLLDQAPEQGLPLVLKGTWIADPLWERWGQALTQRGMDREAFGEIVSGYANELRLWVVGERPWEQVASGLAGRVSRRLSPPAQATAFRWQEALRRIDLSPDAQFSALVARIGELKLLFEITSPATPSQGSPAAIVWAGARPRDPEAPYGVSLNGATGAPALAEALGRFLLKDPAYPPR